MDVNLCIDDDFFKRVGNRSSTRGKELDTDNIMKTYISILESIRSEAIVQGSVANALEAYISCAKCLRGQLRSLSLEISQVCERYLQEIDSADKEFF